MRPVVTIRDRGGAAARINLKSDQLVLRAGPYGAWGRRKRGALIHLQPLSAGPVLDLPVQTESIEAGESRRPHVSMSVLEQLTNLDRARAGGWLKSANRFPGFCASCRTAPKTGLSATPQASLIFQKRTDRAELRGFALKPHAIGTWVEKAKMLSARNPVGSIPALENIGSDVGGQSIGGRKNIRNPLPSKRERPSLPGNQTKPLESTRMRLTVEWSPFRAENTEVGSCSAQESQKMRPNSQRQPLTNYL